MSIKYIKYAYIFINIHNIFIYIFIDKIYFICLDFLYIPIGFIFYLFIRKHTNM